VIIVELLKKSSPKQNISSRRSREPMAESLQKRKYRDWSSMNNEDLISHARKFIEENEIKNRSGLCKADRGLYWVLKKRNLVDEVISEKRKKRDWSSMSNEDLISHARKFIEENEIKNRGGLQKADVGLYQVLRKRNLLDEVISEKEYRDWSSMSNEDLISHARKFIEENEIKNRSGLCKADRGLYWVLKKRNLLDEVISEKREERDWSSMSNEDLISHARKFIEENEIKNRGGLYKADVGLYQVLRKRNLLDEVISEKEYRDWSSMSNEDLISHARKFIEENEIKNRGGLYKADGGLYYVLIKRNLLDEVISEKREERDWSSMSNEDLISHARKFIEENEIKNRWGLQKADVGLYQVLRKRNLLNVVFADIERARKIEAIRQIIEGVKEF